MDILSQLLNVPNIVLCLAIFALVWGQRTVAELFFERVLKKDLSKNEIWSELIMPMGPLGTGALLTLIPQLPVPVMFADGTLNRMVFGIGIGLVSGLAYRLIKKNIYEKLGKKEETEEEEISYLE